MLCFGSCSAKSFNCTYPSAKERRKRQKQEKDNPSIGNSGGRRSQPKRNSENKTSQEQHEQPPDLISVTAVRASSTAPLDEFSTSIDPQQEPTTPLDDSSYNSIALREDECVDLDSLNSFKLADLIQTPNYPKSSNLNLQVAPQDNSSISSGAIPNASNMNSVIYEETPGMSWDSSPDGTEIISTTSYSFLTPLDFNNFLSSLTPLQPILSPTDPQVSISPSTQSDGNHLSPGKENAISRYQSQAPKTTNCPDDVCRCFGRASLILEQLEAREHENSVQKVDNFLSFQRYVIKQCTTFLDCKSCRISSSSMMVPLIICDKLVSSFQLISASSVSSDRGQAYLSSSSCSSSSLSGRKVSNGGDLQSDSAALKGFLGVYEFDGLEEWTLLISSLTSLQLRKAAGLVGRFKTLASTSGWQTQLNMLQMIEERLQEQAARSRLQYKQLGIA